jgi:hypothetical protein
VISIQPREKASLELCLPRSTAAGGWIAFWKGEEEIGSFSPPIPAFTKVAIDNRDEIAQALICAG